MNTLKAIWKALSDLLSHGIMQGIGTVVALLVIILGDTIWLRAVASVVLSVILLVAISRGALGSVRRVGASIGRPSSIIMFILGITSAAILLLLLRPIIPVSLAPAVVPTSMAAEGAHLTEQVTSAATA